MAMLSQFSRFRPSLLKVWICSPLLLAAVGASAQVLAGQTYTITIPPNSVDNSGSETYSVGLVALNGSSPTLTNVSGTTTYVSSPLTAGQYSVLESDTTSGPYRSYRSSTKVSSLYVFPADGSAQSSLFGQYVFQLSGKTANGSGVVAVAGSITADGNGNIKAGVVDINSPAGILAGEPVTGTYQVNAFGIGTLSLVTSQLTLQLTLTSAPLTASTSELQSPSVGTNLGVTAPLVRGGTIATTAGG